MPRTWSRAAPALSRRGPDTLAASTPPMVPRPGGAPNSGPWSIGSKASCWRFSASSASISASGVPAFADSTSSAGS